MSIFSRHASHTGHNGHIAFDRLADLVDGKLPAAERAAALAHVAACARCAADRAWLERVVGVMRTDAGEDAPAHVVARAARLFRARLAAGGSTAPPGPELSRLGRRVLAALRFDSAQAPLALGVRAGQPAARQLLFQAETHDLDVRVTPAAGGRWAVSGQLLGPGEGGRVELAGAAGATQATLNDLSEFTLPPVPPGSYTLRLRLSELEIEVPGLEVGT